MIFSVNTFTDCTTKVIDRIYYRIFFCYLCTNYTSSLYRVIEINLECNGNYLLLHNTF